MITPTLCSLLYINSFKDAVSNEDVTYWQIGRHDFSNIEDIARNCYCCWRRSIPAHTRDTQSPKNVDNLLQKLTSMICIVFHFKLLFLYCNYSELFSCKSLTHTGCAFYCFKQTYLHNSLIDDTSTMW